MKEESEKIRKKDATAPLTITLSERSGLSNDVYFDVKQLTVKHDN